MESVVVDVVGHIIALTGSILVIRFRDTKMRAFSLFPLDSMHCLGLLYERYVVQLLHSSMTVLAEDPAAGF